MAEQIGDSGLEDKDIFFLLDRLRPILETLRNAYAINDFSVLDTPNIDDLSSLTTLSRKWREKFETVWILGAGGSSLGGKMLYELSEKKANPSESSPRVVFFENIDPFTFQKALENCHFDKTGVLAISKSGETLETVAQLSLCLSAWNQAGIDRLSDQFMAISQQGQNSLRVICEKTNIPVLDHDPRIGGRYSILSLVGVLPALIAGVNGGDLRQGAKVVLDQFLSGCDPQNFAPALGAAISVGLAEKKNITQTVLMPYCDRLNSFGRWYCQLWAESLGKNGFGTTPIDALGAVDQHSQLQLYLDGPSDKMFTFIRVVNSEAGEKIKIPSLVGSDLRVLEGRTLNELMDVQYRATAIALKERGRPCRTIEIGSVNERAVGGLIMHFIFETILSGHLLNVDPLDQPAVEIAKRIAKNFLRELEA
ncbi:MAG: glucose-6-phosphate isomerase [Pseudomonadota bacterium]|nr:glucose-6-phosphate isomerase [Pseudomonadota bacterium]